MFSLYYVTFSLPKQVEKEHNILEIKIFEMGIQLQTGTTSAHPNNIIKYFKPPVSKHRHVEKDYWTNKLARRKKMSRIQKVSRRKNRI